MTRNICFKIVASEYIPKLQVIKGSDMPDHVRKMFLKVLSKLKQRIIWKWETEEMEDKPDNVMLLKWCPQQDILGHDNVKLFVTHGGLLSTEESLYHGKPMLYIPGFADQFSNANKGERYGYARQLNWPTITGEKLL